MSSVFEDLKIVALLITLVTIVASFLVFMTFIRKTLREVEFQMKKKPSPVVKERKRKKEKLPVKRLLLFSIVVALYVSLLIPYLFHTSLGHAGVVIYSNVTTLDSLPTGIQEILKLRGINTPAILLVKHLYPEWTTMVITTESFPVNSVVEMSDYIVNWHVDWRDFSFVDQTFDRFVIASVKQVDSFSSSIEMMLLDPQSWILIELSRIDFNVGPILVVFSLVFLFQRRLALWNLPAIFSGYSLQVWRLNAMAYEHNVYVAPEWKYFGYFFIILVPLALYAWHFERSEGGRVFAEKMKILSRALGLPGE